MREKKLTDFVRGKHARAGRVGRRPRRPNTCWRPTPSATSRRPKSSCSSPTATTSTRPCRPLAGLPGTDRAKVDHPVFAPWHALAALPEKDFAAKAPGSLRRLGQADPARPSIRWWPQPSPASRRRLWPRRPSAMASCSTRPNGCGKSAARSSSAKRQAPTALADAGAGGIAAGVPRRRRRAGQRDAVALWRPVAAAGPAVAGRNCRSCARPSSSGAPPAPARRRGRWCWKTHRSPYEPHVFRRGNPEQPRRGGAAAVPRSAGRAGPRSRSPTAAAGWNWPGPSPSTDNPLTARVLVNRRLAAPLRPRPGDDAERFRPAQRAADASRIARPPGDRASWTAAGRSRRCTG